MRLAILLTIVCSISLSSQCSNILTKYDIKFPLNAISIIKGETVDPVTNVSHKISGVVKFQQLDCGSNVTIQIDIVGLPNKVMQRGLHIHAYGISDASDNITNVCGSTGPHFNPTNSTHGFLTSSVRHAGDLGNVITNENGSISVTFEDDMISLYDHRFSIIGRSIVLHELTDDGGLGNTNASLNFGSAGVRIACGVIGLTKTDGPTVQRDFIQGISSTLTDIEDKVKGSWIFDFIKSQVESLRQQHDNDTEVEDDDEDAYSVVQSYMPLSDVPNGIVQQIWGNFIRAKQELESIINNNNDELNAAAVSIVQMMDSDKKRASNENKVFLS